MMTTAILDNGLQLFRTSHAVRSAITTTAELLVIVSLPSYGIYLSSFSNKRITNVCDDNDDSK